MLSAILLAALSGAPFPAPGAYRYTASVNNGQAVGSGSWSVNVTQDAAQTTVAESMSGDVMGLHIRATASLVLGPDLAPLRYAGQYAFNEIDQPARVTVVLTPSTATVAAAGTGQSQRLTLAANTQRFVVIEPGCLAGLFALPAQMAAWNDPTVTWIAPLNAQAQLLSAGSTSSAPRPANLPAQEAVLSIDHPIALTIWYDPSTLVPDEISLPSQNAVLTRVR